MAGWAFNPPVQVTAWDAEGNVATGFAGGVTMAIGTNPSGGTLLGTPTGTASAGVANFAELGISTTGNGYTLVASAGALAATSASFIVGTTGISYLGGPIIYTLKVAALYWAPTVIYSGGPTPGTSGTASTADQSLVAFYLRNLGGSPYFNITRTYFDATSTSIQNVLSYNQYWADSTGPPSVAPTDADIQAEVESGFTSGAWTFDSNTVYAVFSGSGINLGGGFGQGGYCAYHKFFIDALGRNVKYAVMPYDYDLEATASIAGCGVVRSAGTPNNDPAADAEVNVLSHELAETVTDENINAWIVSSGPNAGDEMADLCDFNFGPHYAAANGAAANQSFGGKDFLVQMLWVNRETMQGTPVGCQQTWTTPASVSARRPSRAPSSLAVPRGLIYADRHVMRTHKLGSGPVVVGATRARTAG